MEKDLMRFEPDHEADTILLDHDITVCVYSSVHNFYNVHLKTNITQLLMPFCFPRKLTFLMKKLLMKFFNF
jgi:hypothetical protein